MFSSFIPTSIPIADPAPGPRARAPAGDLRQEAAGFDSVGGVDDRFGGVVNRSDSGYNSHYGNKRHPGNCSIFEYWG